MLKKDNNYYSLNESIKNELFNTSIDISINYAEISLDAFFNEGLFKDIPFVSTLYSVYKIGNTIRDACFVKKLLIFLREYNNGNINKNKLEKFKEKIENDVSYKVKVTENLITYLDRFDQNFKAKLLARLFIACINGNFNWEIFIDLSTIIDRLFINDIKVIQELHNARKGKIIEAINVYHSNKHMISGSIERLRSFGFLEDDQRKGEIIRVSLDTKYKLSSFGYIFYEHCIQNEI